MSNYLAEIHTTDKSFKRLLEKTAFLPCHASSFNCWSQTLKKANRCFPKELLQSS